MHLLIAGIPGTGKSGFAKWLVREHGYLLCSPEKEPKGTIRQARDRSSDVVIDWGFPVSCLSTVDLLIKSGVEPWWFDGDRCAALQSFLTRDCPGTKAAWVAQLDGIAKEWTRIKVLFDARILNVVFAGPAGELVYVSNEDRWLQITQRSR